jgi:hypothetical protein
MIFSYITLAPPSHPQRGDKMRAIDAPDHYSFKFHPKGHAWVKIGNDLVGWDGCDRMHNFFINDGYRFQEVTIV